MSVLIKDMTMPGCCAMCPMCHRNFDGNETRLACYALSAWCIEDEDRLEKCPLVELPEKHGRLIDGDVLWDVMSKYNDNEGAKMPFGYDDTLIHIDSACFVIENAPTVIEAEDE